MIEHEKDGRIASPRATGEQKPRGWGWLGLRYGAEFWGEDDIICVHMSYPTFNKHVENYFQRKGIAKPTSVQIIEVARYLSQVSRWHDCTDEAVSITRKEIGRAHV